MRGGRAKIAQHIVDRVRVDVGRSLLLLVRVARVDQYVLGLQVAVNNGVLLQRQACNTWSTAGSISFQKAKSWLNGKRLPQTPLDQDFGKEPHVYQINIAFVDG